MPGGPQRLPVTRLAGRVAVVTGAGRGVGRALAEKLAGEGACVVVNDLDAAEADATVLAIAAAGRPGALPAPVT